MAMYVMNDKVTAIPTKPTADVEFNPTKTTARRIRAKATSQ
jgi:hypothetical protein